MTFNPDNLHDPICQVFLSENINLDNFCSTTGPDKSAHARNVVQDPCGAAEFFHFMVETVLEQLFQVCVKI